MNELEKAYEEIEDWHLYSEQEGFVAEEEISYLDYVKNYINNLQSKIDKAIEYLNKNNVSLNELTKDFKIIPTNMIMIEFLKGEREDILKEEK